MSHPSQASWFVTGTDTGVGKTFAACALLHAVQRQGKLRVAGMKPVAAGLDAEGRNEDVEQLRSASSIAAPYPLVCPYPLRAAIAPHIAAEEEGVVIDLQRITAAFSHLRTLADSVVVEGVGGFSVPLGEHCDMADLAVALDLPLILVVGIRLGCINHALLSQQAIAARGLKLAGWIANCIDPAMLRQEENVQSLQQRLAAPLLGTIPFGATWQQAGSILRLPDHPDHP
jgi:dethiobiotin synthetase